MISITNKEYINYYSRKCKLTLKKIQEQFIVYNFRLHNTLVFRQVTRIYIMFLYNNILSSLVYNVHSQSSARRFD